MQYFIAEEWRFLFTLSNERTGRCGEVNGSVEIVYSCEWLREGGI